MRGAMRGLGWTIVVAAALAAMAAAGRAILGKFAGEPDTPAPLRGSFDTWPAVPLAPGRLAPNGSRVPAGS